MMKTTIYGKHINIKLDIFNTSKLQEKKKQFSFFFFFFLYSIHFIIETLKRIIRYFVANTLNNQLTNIYGNLLYHFSDTYIKCKYPKKYAYNMIQ